MVKWGVGSSRKGRNVEEELRDAGKRHRVKMVVYLAIRRVWFATRPWTANPSSDVTRR